MRTDDGTLRVGDMVRTDCESKHLSGLIGTIIDTYDELESYDGRSITVHLPDMVGKMFGPNRVFRPAELEFLS